MADENTDLRCYLTNAGIAAENNSIQLNRSLNVTEMVFGSGVLADESDPRAQTAMISEEYAVPCAMLFDEATPTLLVFKSDLPADVGGFHINEVGIRLEDGTIYGYARGKGDYKPTLEQGATDSVRYAVEMYTENADIVVAKIDLSSVYADYEDLTNLETNLLETVNNLDAQNVKLTGNQTIAGTKTFSSPVPVATPTANAHATTKAYVDGLNSSNVKLTGNQTIAGTKTFSSPVPVATPTANAHATTKAYVDGLNGSNVKLTGNQTIAGTKTFSSPVPVATPTANNHATTKAYVDGAIASHEAEYQFLPYDPTRIYKCGEVCYTVTAGKVSYWEWYSSVESLAGKDPLDTLNRQTGWIDETKPFYWTPFKKSRSGSTQWPWMSMTFPEGTLNVLGNSVPTAVFWRLAEALPEFVNVGTGMIDFPETGGEFFRVLDQGRGIDSGRNFASSQSDELKSHRHTAEGNIYSYGSLGPGPGRDFISSTVNTSYTGGSETRPRNLAFPILVEV
ncbi:phage tail-collar fiber domain-containing protein [Vibrio fluvialis]|uniref:phage tail-collar fiber domain-containing protein n=1 Tax=Vibrio fluvialis TaxID=676 RepID=UPI002ACAD290|nr:phage tail protein [Vibrio fluvialis]MDZ5515889.1 phage tail protein [Vibrio fluvialis]